MDDNYNINLINPGVDLLKEKVILIYSKIFL